MQVRGPKVNLGKEVRWGPEAGWGTGEGLASPAPRGGGDYRDRKDSQV